MAKICYVNAITGNNANNGLSAGAAKKTIAGARSATAAATASTSGSPDIVMIAPGVYPEPNTLWNASTDTNVVYMADGTGEVIVDFEQRIPDSFFAGVLQGNWGASQIVIMVGIRFRNPYGGSFPNSSNRMLCGSFSAYHCVFYQRNGGAGTGVGIGNTGTAVQADAENCSFYNLSIGFSGSAAGAESYNNYFVSCTTPVSGTMSRDYNAFPGNTETNGIDTTSGGSHPGFRDATGEDFRLDPTTFPAAYATFLGGGRYGTRIGASGKPGPYYNALYPQLRMITKVPAGTHGKLMTWEDDPSYTAIGTLGAIIQDPTSNELVIDLASTPLATDGRARSDVYDLGATSPNLASFTAGKFEDLPNGAALDTNLTLPKKWEYRSSGSSFLKGDVSPAWVEVEPDDYINISDRYVQFRITFVVNHTNA